MYVDIFPEDRNHSYIHYKYWHLHRAYKLTHFNMSTSHIGICLWPCIGFCTESCNREKYIFLGLLFLGVFNLLVLYVTLRGRTRTTATSLNHSNIFEIVAVFFDYSDLEDVSKDEADRFILGLSKSIIEVYKSKYSDQLPASFKAFFKYISDSSNNPEDEIKIDEVDNSKFVVLIEKFIKYFKDYL